MVVFRATMHGYMDCQLHNLKDSSHSDYRGGWRPLELCNIVVLVGHSFLWDLNILLYNKD